MPELTREELKAIIEEVIDERVHNCQLSSEDLSNIKTLSGFITRARNAIGNFFLVLMFVVALMGVGGLLYLVSGGHINLFKIFGIGG